MSFLIATLGILITIFFVICTHEAAHFLTARALSVKVLTFSIGFGKTLFRWQDKRGTEYLFALIPLGGYVRMLDANEGDIPDSEKHLAYNHQPFYKKFLIIAAGPVMNILCAFVLYWCVFTIGFNTLKPIVGTVTPHSIAANAGIQPHDELISVDERQMHSWMNVIFRLLTHLGNQENIQVVTQAPGSTTLVTRTLEMRDWKVDKLKPDPLASLGLTPYLPPIPLVIGIINDDSPAAKSHLQIGDHILALKQQKITDWQQLITLIQSMPDTATTITVKRKGKTLDLPIVIGSKWHLWSANTGVLGIAPDFTIPKTLLRHVQYSPVAAIARSWQEICDFTYFNLVLFGKLFTGNLSLQSLGGPITIFESAGDALNSGGLVFLGFLAFLSISIGIINILPIPGLDGGHLLLQTIEALFGKPIPERYVALLFRLGFIFIVFILFQSLINDILRAYN